MSRKVPGPMQMIRSGSWGTDTVLPAMSFMVKESGKAFIGRRRTMTQTIMPSLLQLIAAS
jgi:hypothetical protein